MTNFFTKDEVWPGVVVGFALPLIVFLLAGALLKNNFPLFENGGWQVIRPFLPPVVSVSALSNLVVFYIYLNRKKFRAARGVIFATLFYVLAVVVIRFML